MSEKISGEVLSRAYDMAQQQADVANAWDGAAALAQAHYESKQVIAGLDRDRAEATAQYNRKLELLEREKKAAQGRCPHLFCARPIVDEPSRCSLCGAPG